MSFYESLNNANGESAFISTFDTDIDLPREHHLTALQLAARKGYLSAIKHIIAKLELRESNEMTTPLLGAETSLFTPATRKIIAESSALIDAAENGHLNIVKYLVELGASIVYHPRRGWKSSPSHLYPLPIEAAASNGQLNILKYLLEELEQQVEQAKSISPRASQVMTAFLENVISNCAKSAISSHPKNPQGRFPVVKYLIEKGLQAQAQAKETHSIYRISAEQLNALCRSALTQSHWLISAYLMGHGGKVEPQFFSAYPHNAVIQVHLQLFTQLKNYLKSLNDQPTFTAEETTAFRNLTSEENISHFAEAMLTYAKKECVINEPLRSPSDNNELSSFIEAVNQHIKPFHHNLRDLAIQRAQASQNPKALQNWPTLPPHLQHEILPNATLATRARRQAVIEEEISERQRIKQMQLWLRITWICLLTAVITFTIVMMFEGSDGESNDSQNNSDALNAPEKASFFSTPEPVQFSINPPESICIDAKNGIA